MQKNQERYFGSVRFFKNLILLAVVVMIAVPTVFAVRGVRAERRLERENARLSADLTARSDELSALRESLAETHEEDAPGESPFAEPPDYQLLYPDFYAPQPLDASEHHDKVIYLTFDDGPSVSTDTILNTLAEKDVKATFFVVGHDDNASRERMRRIVEEGHTLGMHTYTHSYGTIYASVEDYLADMYGIFTLIRDATGVTPTVFRFPGGSINAYNRGIYQELIAEMLRRGFVPCDWNLSAEDATNNKLTTQDILNNILPSAKRVARGFILMHDSASKKATVAALPGLIDSLREMGFTFSAITPDTRPVFFGYRE